MNEMEVKSKKSPCGPITTYSMPWSQIINTKHSYLVNTPKNSKKHASVDVEKPSPIFNPFAVTELQEYRDIFNSSEVEVRLAYLKKMHNAKKQGELREKVDSGKCKDFPAYVLDIAKNLERYEDCTHRFAGGVLDCLSHDGKTYVVWAGLKQPVHVVDKIEPLNSLEIHLNSPELVYRVKTAAVQNRTVLAVRQRSKVSLYGLFEDGLSQSLLWNTDNGLQFSDSTVNEFKDSQISLVDVGHNLVVKDYAVNEVVMNHSFPVEQGFSRDTLGQVDYLDEHTLCFLNRSCIYLLDLRSGNMQSCKWETYGMDCDDLCSFSKNLNHNSLCITSQHNLSKFDIRAWKCTDRIVHMLASPVLLSTLVSYDDNEYVSLLGTDYKDKAIFYNSSEMLNTPQYVPNILDTYNHLCLTTKVKFSDYINNRLTLPNLGGKLHKDEVTKDVSLYTVNTVGDVFEQRLVKNKKAERANNVLLHKWIDALPEPPKNYEITGCFQMNHIMSSMSSNIPKKKHLKAYMTNKAAKFLDDEAGIIEKYSSNKVANVINELWTKSE